MPKRPRVRGPGKKSLQQRFLEKVVTSKKNACWLWVGGHVSSGGRGRIEVDSVPVTAPRVAWFLFFGEWPPNDLEVCHTCDIPACVNPAHLWLGTHQENMQDSMRKGRRYILRGEEHASSKLAAEQVRAIRKSKMPRAAIAKQYKISISQVGNIRARRLWKHL